MNKGRIEYLYTNLRLAYFYHKKEIRIQVVFRKSEQVSSWRLDLGVFSGYKLCISIHPPSTSKIVIVYNSKDAVLKPLNPFLCTFISFNFFSWIFLFSSFLPQRLFNSPTPPYPTTIVFCIIYTLGKKRKKNRGKIEKRTEKQSQIT